MNEQTVESPTRNNVGFTAAELTEDSTDEDINDDTIEDDNEDTTDEDIIEDTEDIADEDTVDVTDDDIAGGTADETEALDLLLSFDPSLGPDIVQPANIKRLDKTVMIKIMAIKPKFL